MSATTTEKKSTGAQTWLARFKAAVENLDSAKAEARKAQDVFFSKGLAIGYLLVEKYGDTVDKSKREEIVSSISTVGRKANDPRTNLDDKPYSWATVGTWHKAARIESAIAEKNPSLKGKFSADGLTKIATVESKNDLDTAVAFAATLVESGQTSNRAVRAAYDSAYGSGGKSERTPSQIAVAATKELKGTEVAAKRQLTKLKLAPNAIMQVLQFAALVGMTTKDAEASTIVLREMLKETPAKQTAKAGK